MRLRRRDFLRLGGTGLAVAGLSPKSVLSLFPQESQPPSALRRELFADDYPFPYDEAAFACAERVYNVRRSAEDPVTFKADVNLLLKAGKKLDVKILAGDRLEALSSTNDVQSFSGIEDRLDFTLSGYSSPRLYYQVMYREGQGNWKALAPKSVKLPGVDLDAGGEIKVVLISDDHTFDDGDYGVPDSYKAIKLNGDYVNEFMKGLKTNPSWEPVEPLARLKNGFFLAKALRRILYAEDPDFIIHLGDTNGINASYSWAGLGLPWSNLKDEDYDYIVRTLWLRVRKMYSAVTPSIPMYVALGNHDGEEAWNGLRFKAREWRQKYFPLPGSQIYPEGGHENGNYYAFSWGADENNRGGAQFIILDITAFSGNTEPVRPEGWTFGEDQLKWLEDVLKKGEKHWNFACFHHVAGGWPAGPTESRTDIAYGRGPLFTAKDYQGICDSAAVEQVKVTDLAQKYGLRAFLYSHDHIFKSTFIRKGLNQKDLYGVSCGSTKYIAERDWWRGSYWRKYYGDGFGSPPDFWGPAGFTRLTIKANSVRIEYVTAGNTGFTNLITSKAGDIIATTLLDNPPPRLTVDCTTIKIQGFEGRSQYSQVSFKVRNGGAGTLKYQIKPESPWLSVSPDNGKSWGEPHEHLVSVTARRFEEGDYEGFILIESPGVSGSPLEIPVKLVISSPPICPPLEFKAVRKTDKTLLAQEGAIVLSWKSNRLNSRIQKYRIYLLDAAGNRSLLGEVKSSILSCTYHRAKRDQKYRFALTAVDNKYREGEAALTSVD
jgi:3',5'-cyclic AMP phosphodiesterase CpdA